MFFKWKNDPWFESRQSYCNRTQSEPEAALQRSTICLSYHVLWASQMALVVKKVKVKEKSLSRVRLLVTPWTAAYQAPPSMGFSRQEYWSGVPLVKNMLANAGDMRYGFDPRVGKVPWRRKWQPTLVFLLENPTEEPGGLWSTGLQSQA